MIHINDTDKKILYKPRATITNIINYSTKKQYEKEGKNEEG